MYVCPIWEYLTISIVFFIYLNANQALAINKTETELTYTDEQT